MQEVTNTLNQKKKNKPIFELFTSSLQVMCYKDIVKHNNICISD